MFFPGETIIHTFVIPFAETEIVKIIVSYKQNNAIILEKEITTVTPDGPGLSKASIQFTQTESLMFQDDAVFTIQLNVIASDGTRHTSHELKSDNGVQYLREVM